MEDHRRPWVQYVTYGVQRLRGRLDWALDGVLKRPIASAHPALRAVLRLGLYELRETDAPDYAVVSQCVALARAHGGEGGARLTNAVLRKLGGQDARAGFPDPSTDLPDFLTAWGSHPRWLIDRWLARWSPNEVQALVDANNSIPQIYVRAADGDPRRLEAALRQEDVLDGEVVPGVGCFPIRPSSDLSGLLARVGGFVQDPGAAWVAEAVGVVPGTRVVDLCAAPGGKSRALAALGAQVVAGDASEARLSLLGPGGQAAIARFVGDGRRPPLRPGPCVLVDAPCTGTGTLARHPDGRWRLQPRSVALLAELQGELLAAASTLVTPGGLLVYATCSLEPEENQQQVEQFLARHPDFSLEVPSHMKPEWLNAAGSLEILPQRTGFDGAFAARLRRNA